MFHLYSSLRRASARTAVLTLLAIGVLGAGAPGSAHAEPRGPCAGACAKVKVVHNTTAFSSPYFDAHPAAAPNARQLVSSGIPVDAPPSPAATAAASSSSSTSRSSSCENER